MKTKLLLAAIVLVVSASFAAADDKPVSQAQLPPSAVAFINSSFPGEKISYAMVEDDFFRPDYKVVLSDGTKLQFDNSGRLEKVEAMKSGIPADVIPVQIREYVRTHYPDTGFIEYEIDRRSYDVKLTNRLELKFSRNFNIMEVDD